MYMRPTRRSREPSQNIQLERDEFIVKYRRIPEFFVKHDFLNEKHPEIEDVTMRNMSTQSEGLVYH